MSGCFPSEENIRANCTCKCHRIPNNVGCTECKCKPYFGKNNQAPNWDSMESLVGKVDTMMANFISTEAVELLVKTNVENIWKRIDQIEKVYVKLDENLANHRARINNCQEDVKNLQIHKNKQIDENRAVSKHLDKLDTQDGNGHSLLSGRIDALTEMYKELSLMCTRHDDNIRTFREGYPKRPHKCPTCNGQGKNIDKLVAVPYDGTIHKLVEADCHSCEGKGVLWG